MYVKRYLYDKMSGYQYYRLYANILSFVGNYNEMSVVLPKILTFKNSKYYIKLFFDAQVEI